MLVKNLKGASKSNCFCNSWLKHWEKFSGEIANFCCVVTCIKKAEAGAHVINVNSTDTKTFIAPFCIKHNQSDLDLEIGLTTLVSAKVSETCGIQK